MTDIGAIFDINVVRIGESPSLKTALHLERQEGRIVPPSCPHESLFKRPMKEEERKMCVSVCQLFTSFLIKKQVSKLMVKATARVVFPNKWEAAV